MHLFGHPFSNNAMRAQLALEEKGIQYEYVLVDLFKGEGKQVAFLAVNPRGQVPALVDGDIKIWESAAIVEYLERRYPDKPLLPQDPKAMAKCIRLIAEFHQKLDPCNIFGSVKFRKLRREDLGDRIEKLLTECKIWESYLDAPYFTGETLSMADVMVFPFFVHIIGCCGLPKSEFPKLHAWYELCKARPCFAKMPLWEGYAADFANAEQQVLAKP